MNDRSELSPAILAAAETLWDFHRTPSEPCRVDVIVALGSYDLRVASHAAKLFNEGRSELVVATGSYGHWTRERFPRPEAEVFAAVLVAAGLPPGKVMIESKATNIRENVELTKSLLSGKEVSSALLVTKPQTQRRVFATARTFWPEIDTSVCAPDVDFWEQPTERHSVRDLINEMVGDLVRLRLYGERGWQIKQEIPAEVDRAGRFLIDAGFDAHLPQT